MGAGKVKERTQGVWRGRTKRIRSKKKKEKDGKEKFKSKEVKERVDI